MVAFDFLVDSYFCCHIIKFFEVYIFSHYYYYYYYYYLNLFEVEFIIYINF